MSGTAEASAAFAEIVSLSGGPGARCTAGPFLETLSTEDRAAIDQALAAGYAMSAVGKFCVKRGFRYSEQAVVRHLAGRCSCRR